MLQSDRGMPVFFAAILIAMALLSVDIRRHPVQAQAHGTSSEEIPRGAIDGVNTTFTLNFQPAPWGSIHVYRNGLRLQRNLDYTLGGPNHMQIIFNPAAIPQPGPPADTLLADYTY